MQGGSNGSKGLSPHQATLTLTTAQCLHTVPVMWSKTVGRSYDKTGLRPKNLVLVLVLQVLGVVL